MPRVIVVVNAPKGHAEFIAYAKHVAQCLSDATFFPSPNPPLSVVLADIATLDAAEVAMLTRRRDAAGDRDAKRLVVHDHLKQECAYVQQLVSGLPRAEALEIVARSGFSTKESTAYPRPGFVAKQGKKSGSVHLVAHAEKGRASYEWQYSTDGVLWTTLPNTVRADAWVHGLEPGLEYWFRYRVTTKAGTGDWSEPFRMIVS